MLTTQDQQAWDDVQQFWADEADPRPRRTAGRTLDDAPGLVAAGAWAAIFLVLFGAVVAGVAVGAVTAAGLVLWRYRPSAWPLSRLGRGVQVSRRPDGGRAGGAVVAAALEPE
jgi:hypothetical protein